MGGSMKMAQKVPGWFLGMLVVAGIGCNRDKLSISDPATDGEKLQNRLREVLLQAATGQEAALRCNALESLALLKAKAEVQKVVLRLCRMSYRRYGLPPWWR